MKKEHDGCWSLSPKLNINLNSKLSSALNCPVE